MIRWQNTTVRIMSSTYVCMSCELLIVQILSVNTLLTGFGAQLNAPVLNIRIEQL